MNGFYIHSGANDILFAEDGRQFIDLHTGFGAVLLGHANPNITAALTEQAARIWATGRLPSRVLDDASEVLQAHLPDGMHVAGFGSMGLEASEYALRIASEATGRAGFVGFARGMHGKSAATTSLCWPDRPIRLPDFHRLPYFPDAGEGEILGRLEALLRTDTIAGVFVEPILGSGGGYAGSSSFYQEVQVLCERHGALLIVDEILTGFYRTGTRFCVDRFGLRPDILLLGKALGNGFPVSAVALSKRYAVSPSMLPGSTFSGNPLAAAVVSATLREMERLDMPERMTAIGRTVRSALSGLESLGVQLRGLGGLWILELPAGSPVAAVVDAITERGVMVSASGACLRMLPAATIEPEHLAQACEVVKTVCEDTLHDAL